jgi:drug/metabolite transporter (DMT)-like permease
LFRSTSAAAFEYAAAFFMSMTQNNQRLSGVLLVLLAAVGFSAKAIFVKLSYRYGVDSISLLALRMLFSLPFFLLMAWWAGRNQTTARLTPADWKLVIAMGIAGYYLSSLLDFLGLQFISAGLERLILFLYPTFVLVISAIFFQQKITQRDVIALLISYAGVVFVFFHDVQMGQKNVLLGSLLVLASALTYAIYFIGSGRIVGKIGSLRYSAYATLVSCVAVLIHFGLTRNLVSLQQPAQVYLLSLLMALFSTVLPVYFLSEGIRRIGSSHASMIGFIGPVITIFLGSVLLGEQVGATQIVGMLLVLAGVLIISLKPKVASLNK